MESPSLRSLFYAICKKHPSDIKIESNRGWQCKGCITDRRIKKKNDFITQSQLKHGNKYDYSKVDYVDSQHKIIIICKKHGEFKQHPYNHKRGQGCDKCLNDSLKMSQESLLNKLKIKHGNLYDYSRTKYNGCNKSKITIICKKHGSFLQSVNKHLAGQGCPKCKLSHGEKRILNFLEVCKIEFIHQKIFKDLYGKTNKQKLRFDFFLPKHNICIEYDGEQHYEPMGIWGVNKEKSLLNYERIKHLDMKKNLYCKKNNIKLIRIKFSFLKKIEEKLEKELCQSSKELKVLIQMNKNNL